MIRDMAVPPQQQTAPNDHHYFEWSTTSQQKLVEQSLKVVPIGLNQPSLSTNNVHTNNSTNMVHNHPHLQNHPLMTHTHRRHYYQHFEEKRSFEDSKPKLTKTAPGMTPPNTNNSINLSPSPGATNFTSTGHVRKKQKTNTNGIGSTSSTSSLNTSDDHSQSQTCYPFQAELTQKIDIECGGSNGSGQTAHTPTHHFTLSTVINVSVNGQSSQPSSQSQSQQQQQQQQTKYLDTHPSPSSTISQQQCPPTSSDQQDFLGHPSSSPSVLSNSSPSTASPSTTIGAMTNSNNNNPISNLISSTSPSTHMLSQSPSIPHPNASSVSSPTILFPGINLSMYIKDLDLATLDSINFPSCPNPQDYLTIDGLLAFLNTCNTTSLLMSDNNNNNLSMQKPMDYNRRYQTQLQTQQQIMTRSDSSTLRQTPYLPNPTQQYHETYRLQQQQQHQHQQMQQQHSQQSQYMYNYSRTQQFEQQTRYYPNQYPAMMSPYPYPSSYPYPSHNQVN